MSARPTATDAGRDDSALREVKCDGWWEIDGENKPEDLDTMSKMNNNGRFLRRLKGR